MNWAEIRSKSLIRAVGMLTLDPTGVTRETVTITLPSTLWRLAAFSLIIAMGKKQPSVVTLTESQDYGIIPPLFL